MNVRQFTEMIGSHWADLSAGQSIKRIIDNSLGEDVHAWMVFRGLSGEITYFCFIFKAHAFNKRGEWWALTAVDARLERISLKHAVALIENAVVERQSPSRELERQALIENL